MSDDAKLEILLTAKDMTARTFSAFQARIGTITRSVTSLKGAMAALGVGYGLKEIGGAALNVADSFEQMEIKLNALTDGRGTQTLAELNDWAREMPVNTRKAVDTFVMMQALGLDPTIDKMQTLVDVSSIFGEDTMPRVARALGQMQTLGKLSAEELNQLSEAGINARKYLTEAFGMTVEELQKSQVSIDRIIQAIWDGLNADYAGGAQAAMKSWRGLTTVFKSNMTEITRQVMDAGVFDEVKSQLDDINKKMGDWIENNNTLLVSFSENIGAIVEGLGKIAKYAGLRSITGTMQQAGELSKQGLLDLTDFMRLSFVERQKLVDDILAKQRQILASPLQIAAQSSTANATKQQGPRYNPWEAYLPEWTVPPSIVDNFNKPFLDLLPTMDDIESALNDFFGGIDAARNKIHEADTAAWEDFKISLDAWEDSNRERLEEVLNQQDEFDRQMIQLTRHTADAMQQNFSDLFFDALTGELRTFQDYATAIFNSIARAWADMAGQMAAQGLFGTKLCRGRPIIRPGKLVRRHLQRLEPPHPGDRHAHRRRGGRGRRVAAIRPGRGLYRRTPAARRLHARGVPGHPAAQRNGVDARSDGRGERRGPPAGDQPHPGDQ